jgi:hypothetical protein
MASGEIDITPGRIFSPGELVTNQKLNDLSLPTLRVKALSITARELADSSISADKLDVELEAQLGVPDNSVTTAKIVDGAVTGVKIATGATLNSPLIVPITGSSYRPSGVLFANVGDTGNAGGAELTVWTYTVPANLLSRNGDALRITSLVLNNTAVAGTKNFRWKFGGVNALNLSTGAVAVTHWVVNVLIVRESLSAQKAISSWVNSNAGADAGNNNLTSTLSSAIPLIFTLQTPTGADTVRHRSSIVEFVPAP